MLFFLLLFLLFTQCSNLLETFVFVNCAVLGSGDWCDHWKQSVWLIPRSGLPVCKDKEVQLHAVHTEMSISYEFKSSCNEAEVSNRDFHTLDCQIVLLPERISLYGDNEWRYLMLNAIEKAVRFFFLFPDEESLFTTILLPLKVNTWLTW